MRRALLVATLAAAAIAGCGGGDAKLKVSAASSLSKALPAYRGDVDYSFAGSDQLAAQIRAGARPDVFAAANTKLPDQLYSAGVVEKPIVFATNTLVVAVPAGSARVRSFADLAKRGVTIAAGSPTVPVGIYTRQVIARADPKLATAIGGNIRSDEPDVAGIVGKLTQGAVDAGFVYVTDVKGAGGKLRGVPLPARLQPTVEYGAAVVKGTENESGARAFVQGLLNRKGAAALRQAGFGSPQGG
jgi:molybdate transport system substrate-binding protein